MSLDEEEVRKAFFSIDKCCVEERNKMQKEEQIGRIVIRELYRREIIQARELEHMAFVESEQRSVEEMQAKELRVLEARQLMEQARQAAERRQMVCVAPHTPAGQVQHRLYPSGTPQSSVCVPILARHLDRAVRIQVAFGAFALAIDAGAAPGTVGKLRAVAMPPHVPASRCLRYERGGGHQWR